MRDRLDGKVRPDGVDVPGPGGQALAYFAIRAVCTRCRAGVLVFDPDRHGRDAVYWSRAADGDPPRPSLVPYRCPECRGLAHSGVVGFLFDDEDDFAARTGGRVPLDRLPDAFEEIGLDLTCCECDERTKAWVGYEFL